jgi:hypothetical protein
VVGGEDRSSRQFRKTFDDTAEVALLVAGQSYFNGCFLTDELFEWNIGFILGQEIQLEAEERADSLLSPKAFQEQIVLV